MDQTTCMDVIYSTMLFSVGWIIGTIAAHLFGDRILDYIEMAYEWIRSKVRR